MKRPLFLSLLLFSVSHKNCSAETAGPEVFFSVARSPYYRGTPPGDALTLYLPAVEAAGSGSAADLLSDAPSVFVRRLNGPLGLATLSMRGYQSKQTAVLLDDVRLPADITGTVDLSVLPAAGLGKAEVLPGAASSLYGSGAEGGVVQLFTRRLAPGARLAEAGADFSSYATRDYFLKAGAAGRTGDIFLSALTGASGGFQQNSAIEKDSASGRASLDLGAAGRLGVTGLYSRLRTGLPSGTPVPVSEWNGSREKAANSLTDWQASRRGMVSLSWSGGTADLALKADSALSTNRIEAFQWGSMNGATVSDRTAAARAVFRGGAVIGAEATASSLDSGTYGDHSLNSAGVFAQAAFRPLRGLELTPGARLDRSGAYPARLSPKLSAVYAPDEKWKFSASAGAAFQAPTFADLYNPWAAPAPGLKPERSVNYAAGADYGSPAGWYAGATAYYSVIRDRIALDPVTWGAANLDSAFNYGLEARSGWKGEDAEASAGYVRNVAMGRTGTGRYELLNFCPVERFTAAVSASFGGVKTQLDGRGVSQQYTGRGRTGLRLPEYWVFGLKASRQFGGLEVWGGIANLFDRHYAETADAFNGWFPQPGRTFSAGLSWRLL